MVETCQSFSDCMFADIAHSGQVANFIVSGLTDRYGVEFVRPDHPPYSPIIFILTSCYTNPRVRHWFYRGTLTSYWRIHFENRGWLYRGKVTTSRLGWLHIDLNSVFNLSWPPKYYYTNEMFCYIVCDRSNVL